MLRCLPTAIATTLTLSASLALKHTSLATPLSTQSKMHQSERLSHSGQAKVGAKMPFFSGWTASSSASQAYSLSKALKENKSRYILNICASWCQPCLEGLQKISDGKSEFQSRDVKVIFLVADRNDKARELVQRFKLDWATVIVDEFNTFALKFAPLKASGTRSKKESLSLPKTIIFNQDGVVETIIGKEGSDYIDVLLKR